jgi:hypothetical protein
MSQSSEPANRRCRFADQKLPIRIRIHVMADHERIFRFARTLLVGCWAALICACAIAGQPPLTPAKVESPPDLNIVSFDEVVVADARLAARVPPAGVPPAGVPPAGQSPVIKRVLTNWRARQQRIESFHIAWNSWRLRLGNASPPDAHTEVWVERELRHRVVHSSPPNQVVSVSTFDGMISRGWNAQTQQGELWNGDQRADLYEFSTRIWCLALDPLSSGDIDVSAPQFRVLKDNAVIGDRRCIKLEQRIQGRSWPSQVFETIWIDPQRDDVIAGWERRTPEAAFFFISIEYARDPHHGWLPTRWDNANTSMTRSASAIATKLTVNERFPIETFRLSFPAGTRVNDRGVAARYEIAANGSKANVEPYYPAEIETIYDCLNEKTDFIVDPEPLESALEFIAKRYHMKFAFDAEGVRRGLVDPLVNVKMARRGIKLSELLDLLLKQSPKPLKYEIRNDVVTVVSGR